jgi:uroporphyrinogen decarboxylase
MNKRERVFAALQGRKVDYVPFTVWRHFYFQAQTGEDLARSTINFYRQYDLDMIVLAPGPFYMAEAWGADVRSFSTDDMAPYLGNPLIGRATDWRHLPEVDVAASSLRREIEAVRLCRAQLEAEDAPLVVPLFSPLTTANILCKERIVQDIRSYSNDLRSALEVIATATREFALACLDAGADGFMFATHLATGDTMRTREYRDFGQRFDLEVLDLLKHAAIRILHLVGTSSFFDLVDRYPVQAVCWETWRSDPSLAVASRQTRRALMGGLNPMTFSGGAVADIRDQIEDATSQTGGWSLLIAPSGPLPPNPRQELLAAMSELMQTR